MECIHCNICGSYPFSGQRRFLLASCGHVVCDNCSRKFADTCPLCNTKCRLVEINGQSAQDVKVFFMDGSDLLKDSFKRINQVLQFQKKHIKSLGTHYKNKVSAFETLRDEFGVIKKENETLRTENEDLRRILGTLKKSSRSPSVSSSVGHLPRHTPQRTPHNNSPLLGTGNFLSAAICTRTPGSGSRGNYNPGGNIGYINDTPASNSYRTPLSRINYNSTPATNVGYNKEPPGNYSRIPGSRSNYNYSNPAADTSVCSNVIDRLNRIRGPTPATFN